MDLLSQNKPQLGFDPTYYSLPLLLHTRTLILKVTGDLLCGSRRGESPRQANNNDFLALCVVGNVDEIRREVLMEIDGRNGIASGNVQHTGARESRHWSKGSSGGKTCQKKTGNELHRERKNELCFWRS
jgi:hypothetical protein